MPLSLPCRCCCFSCLSSPEWRTCCQLLRVAHPSQSHHEGWVAVASLFAFASVAVVVAFAVVVRNKPTKGSFAPHHPHSERSSLRICKLRSRRTPKVSTHQDRSHPFNPESQTQPTRPTTPFCYCEYMRRTTLLAILTALLITGCKTNNPEKPVESIDSAKTPPTAEGPTPEPTPTHQPAPTNDHRPVIVCFGDSLTEGHGAEFGKSYPDYLQSDLDARGYHYRVVNEGISGNTTKDGVERLDNVLALKPAIVIVEFGGNDGLRGLRIEDTRANLDKIVATLKASGTKVSPRRHHPPTRLRPRLHPAVQPDLRLTSPRNTMSPSCPSSSKESSE